MSFFDRCKKKKSLPSSNFKINEKEDEEKEPLLLNQISQLQLLIKTYHSRHWPQNLNPYFFNGTNPVDGEILRRYNIVSKKYEILRHTKKDHPILKLVNHIAYTGINNAMIPTYVFIRILQESELLPSGLWLLIPISLAPGLMLALTASENCSPRITQVKQLLSKLFSHANQAGFIFTLLSLYTTLILDKNFAKDKIARRLVPILSHFLAGLMTWAKFKWTNPEDMPAWARIPTLAFNAAGGTTLLSTIGQLTGAYTPTQLAIALLSYQAFDLGLEIFRPLIPGIKKCHDRFVTQPVHSTGLSAFLFNFIMYMYVDIYGDNISNPFFWTVVGIVSTLFLFTASQELRVAFWEYVEDFIEKVPNNDDEWVIIEPTDKELGGDNHLQISSPNPSANIPLKTSTSDDELSPKGSNNNKSQDDLTEHRQENKTKDDGIIDFKETKNLQEKDDVQDTPFWTGSFKHAPLVKTVFNPYRAFMIPVNEDQDDYPVYQKHM